MAKIRAVTGFEYGLGVWSGGQAGGGEIEKAVFAATNGELQLLSALKGQPGGSIIYPSKDTVTQGYYLERAKDFTVVNPLPDGFEVSVSARRGEGAFITDKPASIASFEIGGVAYKIQWTTDVGFSLYNFTTNSAETLSGANNENKTNRVWESAFVRVWREDDGSGGTNWYARMTSSKNSSDIVYFSKNISGLHNIENVVINGNGGEFDNSSNIDDLTLYEPTGTDIADWTSNLSTGTNDFNPQLHEVAVIQTGGTEKTIDPYIEGTPTSGTGTVSSSGTTVTGTSTTFTTELAAGDLIIVGSETRIVTAITSDTELEIDQAPVTAYSGDSFTFIKSNWKPSSSTIHQDISDSNMTTYAEVGTDKTGWKMDGSKLSDMTLTLVGTSFVVGEVVGIATHLTNVADDGDDEVTSYISSANAKQPDGTTAHTINTEQSHILQTVNGNASQLIHYFDFFDDPIDPASLDDLIVAHKLTT